MKPWVCLDTAAVPGGSAPLRLMRRDEEYSIMLGTNELMNSRLSGSEQALADLSASKIAGRTQPRVLIGGLGMGFTLRSALSAFSADAEIVVAELVPEVIAWARGALAPVFGTCLSDPRVTLVNADVGSLIASPGTGYDAILLDVDNGPDGVSRAGNDRLYGAAGLKAARTALRPAGVLAVWSSGPSLAFTKRLQGANFGVETVRARARSGGRGARHIIWIATRPGRTSAQP